MQKKTLLLYFLFFCLWIIPFAAKCQRYGLPGIRNYTRAEYNAGTQNWSLAQAENGLMYFANNNGLVEFDGTHWKLYPTDAIIRSVCIDKGKIYTGAFNEFGYYQPDESGNLKYHSLKYLVDKQIKDFDEIWRIHKTSFGIVFQSFKAIFNYNQDKIEIVSPRFKFQFSYYVNGILWVYDGKEGLMQYRDGKVRHITGGEEMIGTGIWTILPLNDDQVIVGTTNKGLFRYDGEKFIPWDTPVNAFLKKYQLYSGAIVEKKYFAFGTIQNGLIISDTNGQVVFHINKEKGLLNNTVLSIGSDQQGNLWLGLDNAISLIHFSSPLTFIKNYVDIGSGYVSARFGDNLYLGTNQGLFYIKWSDFLSPLKTRDNFHLVEGTEGQVWCLVVIDNKLLCGHTSGVFEIHNNSAEKISSVAGGWTIRRAAGNNRFLLVGNYSGISVLERKGSSWIYRNELAGFDQSSHFLEFDAKGNIWVGHGYKGIYRLKADADFRVAQNVEFYNANKGLPSDLGSTLFKLNTGIAAGTVQGIYRYNETSDRFEPDNQFRHLIPVAGNIDYLMQDNANNIWYYNNNQAGVLRYQKDGSYKNVTNPFNNLAGMLIPAYGHINPIDDSNVLFGVEDGFAHYSTAQNKNYSIEPTLYISNIHSGDTSEGNFRYNSFTENQQVIPRFKFSNNSIMLTYASNNFSESGTQFQIYLKGFDQDWSEWSLKTTKEYTNLPYGDYIFQLRAMKGDGAPSPVLSYKFSISPPWYFSTLAWIIYFLLFLAFAYFMYRFYLRSIEKSRLKEKEQQRAKYKQREQQFKEEALEAEREMIRLRSEKLNLEMIHKEKELANSTMMIIQKNEILHKLRLDLNKVKTAIPDEQHKNELNVTIKRIGKEIDNEKQWKVFNTHVEQVHEDLFKKLKELSPELTPREISLCAYLRMNISSKEVATLMNISTRGVEISRYRIRKKLGLDRNTNLTDFMMKLT